MTKPIYGVSIPTYGGCSWQHSELRRQLAWNGVTVLELRGAPYPEMTRAEQVRQALASDIEVLVMVDPSVDVGVEAIEKLVEAAAVDKGLAITCSDDWSRALDFAAVHRDILEKMVEEEKRRYSNSAVDTVWSGKSAPAVPLASPWNRDGSPLVVGDYLTDAEAFMIRAGRAMGSRVQRLSSLDVTFNRRPIRYRHANIGAPITVEPGSKFALCIPSFGALDLDQRHLAFQLEQLGMTVFQIHDCPWIDAARSWLAEQALSVGKGVFFLDHDVIFHPNDVLRLCEQALDMKAVVAGAYCMRKGGKSLIGSFDVPPGPITFFEGGATLPAYYSGLGFAAIPFGVLLDMNLPSLYSHELGRKIRPWFALDCSTGFYAGEDVSFCNRVHDLTVTQRSVGCRPQAAGEDAAPTPAAGSLQPDLEWEMSHSGRPARVFIDTRVRLAHRGSYDYGVEDVGCVVPRYQSLEMTMFGSKKEAREHLVKVDQLPAGERVEMLECWGDEAAGCRLQEYPETEKL